MRIISPSLKENRCFEFDLSGTKLSIEVPPIRSQNHYKGQIHKRINIYQDLKQHNSEINSVGETVYEAGWGFKTGFLVKSHIGDLALSIGLSKDISEESKKLNCFRSEDFKEQTIRFSKQMTDIEFDQGGPTKPEQIEYVGNGWFRYIDFIPELHFFKHLECVSEIHYATPITEHIILDFHFSKHGGFSNIEHRDKLFAEHDKLIEFVMSKVKLELSEDAKHQKAMAQ